jgi:hypothetical protein
MPATQTALLAGEMQLWIDGKSVIEASGLVFRDTETAGIKGIHFQTFFGGMDHWRRKTRPMMNVWISRTRL